MQLPEHCTLCPRRCGANRAAGRTGYCGAGDTLLAAIIVLAVMILPSIISVSETALRAVPREYEEASLALGAVTRK